MDGLSRTKHWALGAIVAALCSFVYAKAPAMSHFSGASHGEMHRGFAGAGGGGFSDRGRSVRNVGRFDTRGESRSYAAQRTSVERVGGQPARTGRLSRDAAMNGSHDHGFSVDNAARHPSGPSYAAGNHGLQYAGAITPVSTESRLVPRPPGNAPVRTGSIRADITRYNEERGASRVMPRQADEGRPPENNPYRN